MRSRDVLLIRCPTRTLKYSLCICGWLHFQSKHSTDYHLLPLGISPESVEGAPMKFPDGGPELLRLVYMYAGVLAAQVLGMVVSHVILQQRDIVSSLLCSDVIC